MSKANPTSISVIMPAYEAEKTIGRALESIFLQTFLPSEVIVIDDGSKDATVAVVQKKSTNRARVHVRIIRQDHKGAGAARNAGLQVSQSNYVAFLDADDEWLPEKLERSIEEIIKRDCLLVAHNYILCRRDGSQVIVNKCHENFLAFDDPYVGLYQKGYIATSSVLAKTKEILDVGGFNESLLVGQDFALWLSLLNKRNVKFHVFQDALLKYHVTPNSITSKTNQRLKYTVKIARMYRPALFSRRNASILIFWLRLLSVHYEAWTAHISGRRYFSAMKVMFFLPMSLFFDPVGVKKFGKINLSAPVLWVWVITVSLIYIGQFSNYLEPLWQLLRTIF